MIPFTDLQSQYQEAKTEIDEAIEYILRTNSFITGPVVEEFEQNLVDYTGAEACASCSSGTTALQIALKACGIGCEHEVITVSHTFVSTPEAVVNVGATPVFCDIDNFYHMDIEQIESLITERTKAILWVDLYGQTPDIDKIIKIARKHNLYTIQDAAQSFGYSYKGKRIGSLSDITCVSFNPVKNLGAMGDAGCVLGRKDLVELARMYRDHGRKEKYNYEVIGYNARIDNLQARIIQAKLPYLQSWLERKHSIASYFSKSLKDYYEIPREHNWGKHTYYVYVLQARDRTHTINVLKEEGIATNIHYLNPAHMTPAFDRWHKDLPKTEHASKHIFSIPCYFSLTDSQVNMIVEKVKSAI